MSISPQLGQLNFVASSPGGIVRLHDMHLGITMVILSLTATPQGKLDITIPTYICYLLMRHYTLVKSPIELEEET
jgi:hypothetical protein